MADRKNYGAEDAYNSIDPSPFFNRSVTISASADNSKRSYLNSTASFQRNGSIRGSYSSALGSLKGKVRKLCSIFESPIYPSNPNKLQQISPPFANPNKLKPEYRPLFRLPGTEDRVVIYYTSLRGIRKTFQDCHSIRMIFRGFRVNIDERDISMDAAYKKELQSVLGEKSFILPQVFVKGKYIGGADVINHLLEAGELVKLIKGMPLRLLNVCEGCDDVRFIPCTYCDGSCKVFDDEHEQPKKCPVCNENGLVRCPLCVIDM